MPVTGVQTCALPILPVKVVSDHAPIVEEVEEEIEKVEEIVDEAVAEAAAID